MVALAKCLLVRVAGCVAVFGSASSWVVKGLKGGVTTMLRGQGVPWYDVQRCWLHFQVTTVEQEPRIERRFVFQYAAI
jgi:hypothetical protein